ncbi:sugar porter family MFS transporter [Commensalibacter papalotli (ex Servin-Garciduenas et al. 2014)]|uniref:Xylose transporter n=1 Tax=Commensalibacter papalotli (ex Servin-Garciduenas et al. 2014) TaxID=1208583 RepID=W7E881_9PROT|nr:sugar porter family MFS transporter [Commensalibacter papalotli (ex Servin-Garciduenas et al. 2014)]EUK19351.1 xylose transporter [Commensalibacter papalotli (ex Servin-Garciduenas et al. 2014)]
MEKSKNTSQKWSMIIILSSITSALAGFLFGYDTVVISGAELKIQALWNLSPQLHGFVTASALYGTVVGALIGIWPANHFGRKITLLIIALIYVVSSLGTAFAPEVYSFVFMRFLGGLAIGASTVVAPLYIAEISPPQYRGRLAGMFQLNVVLSMVIAYIANSLIAGMGEHDWRWMLGMAAIPSIIYTICCLFIPESPRWLISIKNNTTEATSVLKRFYPTETPEQIENIVATIKNETQSKLSNEKFWSWRLHLPIFLAILIALFNQASGINAVLYFAPRIFELTGLGEKAALLQSIGVGVTFLIFTAVGVALIDRLGRKTLLYIGGVGYVISLALIAWGFAYQYYVIIPPCIFLFIASHAIGQGTVIWVLISEIFPNQFRAQGQAVGSFTHWLCAAVITTVFPSLVTNFSPSYVFMFFCFMMIIQLFWIKYMVVETKGIPLEEVQKKLGII